MIGFQPYETFKLLIENGGIERANTLLVAACDAFAQRPKPDYAELQQFEALAERLFPSAESEARTRAALKLTKAPYLSPMLERLVMDNIGEDVDQFLAEAEDVSDDVLLSIIAKNDADQIAKIAARPNLSSRLVATLFPINSRKVYRALAANPSIEFKGPYLRAISKAAGMDQKVAWSLAAREDFDKAYLLHAFFDLKEADRIKVLAAFEKREIPKTPMHRTFEHISVATSEFTQAMMKLLSKNQRPKVTRLLTQVTGLDELKCGEIAHDVSGAALFVVLRAFGCSAQDGLKVLIHASSRDRDNSKDLKQYAHLFQHLKPEAMVFILSLWRGDVEINALDKKAEHIPAGRQSIRTLVAASAAKQRAQSSDVLDRAANAVSRLRNAQ